MEGELKGRAVEFFVRAFPGPPRKLIFFLFCGRLRDKAAD
jgi:hypothetical protein